MIGLSKHREGGWQGQFRRLQRWKRLLDDLWNSSIENEEQTRWPLDVAYAFFQNCWHLKDWLLNSGALLEEDVQDLYASFEMTACRDICNGTKHFSLRNSPTAFAVMQFEGDPPHEISLLAGSARSGFESYTVPELADKCMNFWIELLKRHGLLKDERTEQHG